jgi:polar amino acid transport system substrate-binding protein
MKKLSAIAAILILALSLASCGDSDKNSTISSAEDLPGKVIGVQLGTTGDIYATDYEEEGSTVQRFKTGADAILALKQGKVDCVIIDNEPANVYVSENDDLTILDEPFADEQYAIAVGKGNEALLNNINAALKAIIDEGTLENIKNNYIGENKGKTPYVSPEGIVRQNGELKIGTNSEFPPYEYKEGDKVVGFDIDVAQAICDKLGRELVIVDMDFDAILAAIASGKVDVGIAAMTVTEERSQSVNFSTSYTTATQVIIVRK